MVNIVMVEDTWPTRFCTVYREPSLDFQARTIFLFLLILYRTSRAKGANTNIYEMCLLFLSLQ